MTTNAPYDFLGYKLLKADVHREQDGGVELFSIRVVQGILDEKTNIFSLDVTFSFKYLNNSPSHLFFRGAYRINNHEWYQSQNELQRIHTFFQILFPYMRTMAEQFTDDIRGWLVVPIIDLSQVNLQVGITFKPNLKN
jgi:hypothetical protein